MRSLRVFLLLAFFSVANSVTLPKQFQPLATGGMEGFVFDQAGIPVPMASVQVCNTLYGGCGSAISQPNGYYEITGLAAGRYTLWAQARRYTSEWIPIVIVEEGKMTRQDLLLRREIPTMESQPERYEWASPTD